MTTNISVKGSKASSTSGRQLISSTPFTPGALIAHFPTPLIAIPESPRLHQVCSNCLSLPHLPSDPAYAETLSKTLPSTSPADAITLLPNSKPVKRCVGCSSVSYCSKDCQAADYKRVHKLECKVFQRVSQEQGGKTLPTPVRAALQVMLRWGKMKAAFEDLESHIDEFKRDGKKWSDISIQALAVTEYAGLVKQDGSPIDVWAEVVRGVLCKIQTNAFHRLDTDVGQDGIFLDPLLAMVNHSCTPNAFVYFFGRNAYLKAQRPVKKGEELTISYIDYTHPKYHRLQGLRGYHFICSCPRCSSDLNSYEVCKSSPNIELNAFSLQPDFSKYKSPPSSKAVTKAKVTELHRSFHAGISPSDDGATPMSYLATHWKACKPLVDAKLFALQPLPQIFSEAMGQVSSEGRYVHALCIACFQAVSIEPYLYPHPFAQTRLKTYLAMAKLLVNIVFAQSEAPGAWFDAETPFHERLRATLKTEDPILLAQSMLIMVEHYATMAHDENWNPAVEARGILKQFEGREDREELTAALREWERHPTGEMGKNIFGFMVGKPLNLLAGYGVEVMQYELGKDFPAASPEIH